MASKSLIQSGGGLDSWRIATEAKDTLITRIVELMYDGITSDKVMLEILQKEKVVNPDYDVIGFRRWRIANQNNITVSFSSYRKDFNLKAIAESDIALKHIKDSNEVDRVAAINTILKNIKVNGLTGDGDGEHDSGDTSTIRVKKHNLGKKIKELLDKAKKDA